MSDAELKIDRSSKKNPLNPETMLSLFHLDLEYVFFYDSSDKQQQQLNIESAFLDVKIKEGQRLSINIPVDDDHNYFNNIYSVSELTNKVKIAFAIYFIKLESTDDPSDFAHPIVNYFYDEPDFKEKHDLFIAELYNHPDVEDIDDNQLLIKLRMNVTLSLYKIITKLLYPSLDINTMYTNLDKIHNDLDVSNLDEFLEEAVTIFEMLNILKTDNAKFKIVMNMSGKVKLPGELKIDFSPNDYEFLREMKIKYEVGSSELSFTTTT
jgi:hypothetical protein